jgi:carbon storage regulator
MLVLTRKLGQEIVIAGSIHVTIAAIDGSKVRIGISAPANVRVDREEVHRRRSAPRHIEREFRELPSR